jgi:hypothetical protein
MTFLLHLKALLYKELYLLRSDKKRLLSEFVMPMIIMLFMFNPFIGSTARIEEERSWIDYGYISTSNSSNSVFGSPDGSFGYCLDGDIRIGIVSPKGFFELFNKLASNLSMNTMKFESIDAMKEYARHSHEGDKVAPKGLCLGVAIEILEEKQEFSYTLFVKDTNTIFTKEGEYNHRSLYNFSSNT